jgi:catechol 2,3-dioxygenase-like lactoylglutathione lyase family enzyme
MELTMTTGGNSGTGIEFECITPIFRVEDLRASLDYYRTVLGFKQDWGDQGFASVSRGRCHLMLCEGDQGHAGAWVWIGVGDAGQLFEEYQAKGAKVRHPPTNYAWAYEMQIEDLDGNVLRFGSNSKKDEPMGPFLDMYGVLWEPKPGGGWAGVTKG